MFSRKKANAAVKEDVKPTVVPIASATASAAVGNVLPSFAATVNEKEIEFTAPTTAPNKRSKQPNKQKQQSDKSVNLNINCSPIISNANKENINALNKNPVDVKQPMGKQKKTTEVSVSAEPLLLMPVMPTPRSRHLLNTSMSVS